MENLELPKSYTMKVCPTLLSLAFVQGVKPDDMVEFFAIQVQAMLAVPPNYNFYGQTAPVWIMRGFFPETSVLFKLIVIRSGNDTIVKASIPIPKIGKGRFVNKMVYVKSVDINRAITNKMENALLGGEHEIKSLFAVGCRMPRCMSPRGVKIFSYKKPKHHKNPDTKNKGRI